MYACMRYTVINALYHHWNMCRHVLAACRAKLEDNGCLADFDKCPTRLLMQQMQHETQPSKAAAVT